MGNPLEKLWKDRCTVYQQIKSTNPKTKLTEFIETETIKDQPCKLSFETLSTTGGDAVAIVSQSVKLFLSSKIEIPTGCKIVVKRFYPTEQTFVYARSGEAGMFTYHQEIPLVPFGGYA